MDLFLSLMTYAQALVICQFAKRIFGPMGLQVDPDMHRKPAYTMARLQ